jgi:phage gpG-like protein
MSFSIDKSKSVTNLSKRLKEAPNVITQQIQKIINESVIAIENNARNRAPLGKTGQLKASIYSTPYNMNAGAKVGSRAFYSPFVEFGTGPGPGDAFQIPVYRNLNMNQLEGYARTFKRNNGNVVNLPHRPFLFLSASEELYKMVNKIKKIKI